MSGHTIVLAVIQYYMHALKSNFNVAYIDKFTLTHERNVHNLMGPGLNLLILFQKLFHNLIQDYGLFYAS